MRIFDRLPEVSQPNLRVFLEFVARHPHAGVVIQIKDAGREDLVTLHSEILKEVLRIRSELRIASKCGNPNPAVGLSLGRMHLNCT